MAEDAGVEAKQVAGAITSMGVDELISNLAIGIAEGQMKLDQASMDIARFMSEAQVAFGKKPGTDEPDLLSMIELGFSPNFYQFVDTIIEVRVAVSSKFEETREYDTSDTQFHSNEVANQRKYESEQSRSDSGKRSSSRSDNWSFLWWGGGSSHSSSSDSGIASSSSSRHSSSSSYKSKSLALTTVDAKYASTYNYAVEGSSLIKTKIVPVPPPDVFEETVRAKIEQRREWEKLLSLRNQVKSILPKLASTAMEIKSSIPGSAFNTYEPAKAKDLYGAVQKWTEGYTALTTDHWAIIASVKERQILDEALQGADSKAESILKIYQEDLPDSTEAKKVFMAMAEDLNRFDVQTKKTIARLLESDELEADDDESDDNDNESGEA